MKRVNDTHFHTNREQELAKATAKKLETIWNDSSKAMMWFYTGLLSYAMFECTLAFLNSGEQRESIKPGASLSEAHLSQAGIPRSLTV